MVYVHKMTIRENKEINMITIEQMTKKGTICVQSYCEVDKEQAIVEFKDFYTRANNNIKPPDHQVCGKCSNEYPQDCSDCDKGSKFEPC